MKNLSRAACFSLFFCLFLLFGRPAHGQAVVINEIAWMGSQTSSNDEWIELYNNTQTPIDLSGWKLTSQDGTPEISLAGKIPAAGFYLLERTDDQTVPNVVADLIYTGALSNNGENLILSDSASNLVERINCSPGWFAGVNQEKLTMEKIDSNGLGADPDNWQDSQNAGGTPKAKNSAVAETPSISEEPTQPKIKEGSLPQEEQLKAEIEKPASQTPVPSYQSGIIINEILPSPTGADETEEWIEIFNQNQSEVDLSGWQLKDSVGTLTVFTFPTGTKIAALGFLVFHRPTTKIVLNNDGDGVSLLQPDGHIVEIISYPKAPLGRSWNRDSSDWSWSNQLTPGAKNIIPESASQSDKTVVSENAADQPEGLSIKEGLAAAAKAVKNNFIIPLAAAAAAVFSAVVILTLKRKLNKNSKNFKKELTSK